MMRKITVKRTHTSTSKLPITKFKMEIEKETFPLWNIRLD
jgi:hypothetical protein